MAQKFLKDKWIKSALYAGYLKPNVDGTILRYTKVSAKGELLPGGEYRLVTYQTHNATGRVYFNLTWLGFTKSVLVNRVIALAFLPNPNNLPQVNHIDGDKQHNYLRQPTPELIAKWGEYQLEWSSGSDNEKHAHRTGLKTGRGTSNANAKLTAAQVLEIRASNEPIVVLMKRYNIARSTITNIQKRYTWKHI